MAVSLTFNSTPANLNWYGTGDPIKANEQNYIVPSDKRITSISLYGTLQGPKTTFTFYLASNTNGADLVTIGSQQKTTVFNEAQPLEIVDAAISTTNGNLYAGKKIHLKVVSNDTSASVWNPVSMTVNLGNKLTAVAAGDPIKKTDLTQTGATPDSNTLIKYRTKFSAGTSCDASTFNSQVLGF